MIKRSFLDSIKSLFKNKKKEQESQQTASASMAQIRQRMDILNQKAKNLKENYPEERLEIENLYAEITLIEPSTSVRAGKFEWALGQAITRVSSALDKIYTAQSKNDLLSEIALLKKAVRERQNADIETAEDM